MAIQPYIGKNFSSRTSKVLFKNKILILGKNHYGEGTQPILHIIECIKKYGIGCVNEKPSKYYTKIAKLFLNKSKGSNLTLKERQQFWEEVAFYNYIPTYLPGPRKNPTKKQWENAKKPFEDICKLLEPELIVILGIGLNKHVPNIESAIRCCLKDPSTSFSYVKERAKLPAVL